MNMGMRVRLVAIPGKVMLMPVMLVMPVQMLVLLKGVLMHMLMALAQMEPDAHRHQTGGHPEAGMWQHRPDDERKRHTEQRGHRNSL